MTAPRAARDYDDIPGTYVFDGRRSRRGYPLNTFLMSLNDAVNRQAFKADEAAYLDGFALDAEQRRAVLDRAWITLLDVGGNLYYTYKLAACDGLSFQDLAGAQTGMTADEYGAMMRAGGRPVDGNRSWSEWAGRSAADGVGAGQSGQSGQSGREDR
ncbi:MAG TPA: protocatechuate 4,5-dioxygenase subunit alpha [Acidimicrobiales bacterium]|nr:protocatechuate 4,5-dioxygenase subunit alpha [Acidimicrobiales bacterium]